jgi:hypothetical protein
MREQGSKNLLDFPSLGASKIVLASISPPLALTFGYQQTLEKGD